MKKKTLINQTRSHPKRRKRKNKSLPLLSQKSRSGRSKEINQTNLNHLNPKKNHNKKYVKANKNSLKNLQATCSNQRFKNSPQPYKSNNPSCFVNNQQLWSTSMPKNPNFSQSHSAPKNHSSPRSTKCQSTPFLKQILMNTSKSTWTGSPTSS